MPRRVSVRGIIFKDGKLLCVRHRENDGTSKNNYATPGGGLEENEALIDGIQREMIEETGIAPKVGKLLFIQQFNSPYGFETLDFFFHIENPEAYEAIDLTKTTHGEKELAEIKFIDPKTEPLLPTFLTKLDLAHHIAVDGPVMVVDNFYEVR